MVDVYDISVRYLSWKMVLFGDSLYRLCFKPDGDQQKAAQVFLQNGPFSVSPTQVVFRAIDTARDLSEFSGKYVSIDSRVLSH